MTIKRYHADTIGEHDEGCIVLFADHAAEVERLHREYMDIAASVSSDLHKARERIKELEAENARLKQSLNTMTAAHAGN
jgi:predicted nuclease with TOPRIM domain